jgi:predicted ATPase
MSYSAYPKGSEWRKWDLQIHTILDDDYVPLSKYSDDIKKNEPELWKQYVAKVGGEQNALLYDSKPYFSDGKVTPEERCLSYARNLQAFLETFNPGLACIGITDHNYFDDQLLDVLVDYSRKGKCKVIPGVEINCSGIHMLLFFSKIPCEQETFSEGITTLLKRFDITTKKKDGVLTTTSKDPKKIIDEVNDEEGLVIFPHCNSNNGLFQERTKTDRTHLANIFNHQRVNLLQSQNRQGALEVEEYIGKNKKLTSKFCCHTSSDARSLPEIGRPDSDGNFLWIKADLSFEGLKQIMYEPDRIFIGVDRPEQKKSYFLIDKVRFLDNTEKISFSSESIEINQNLTTIIGGKSTGKSLLLYHIAKTIDPEEVENRTAINELSIVYDLDSDPNFNFEVTWMDGQQSLLKIPEGPPGEDSKDRKLLYIPQKYLNTLSEANIRSREALNQFVLDVILQDAAVSEQYEEAIRKIKTASRNIPFEIADLFLEKDDIKQAEEELKQIGDEKGIRNYIKPLQQQVDEIKAKSGFDEVQSKQYESLTVREKRIIAEVSNLTEDKKTIKKLDTALATQLKQLVSVAEEYEDYLRDDEIKKKFSEELKVLDSVTLAVQTSTGNTVRAIDAKIQRLNDDLAKIKTDLTPLLAKVQLQSELRTKTDAIKKEEQKLNDISIKKNTLKTKKASYEKKAGTVLETYKQIAARYDLLRNEFKKFESKFGEIALSVLVGFKDESFNANVVREYLNRKDLKRMISENDWGEDYIYKYDSTKHLANITAVFEGLLDGTIGSVKNRLPRDAATKLLEDHFYLDFRIFYKGDSFDKMSPGKKGLVLLQVLINLSNEEWPILLDQPEDDLDNRSVYEDLVSFLKRKKTQRQIIIVTHNPNLVVGADAEETIVANQSGQEVNRENKKFQFEYVSGALENTFELDPAEETAILLQKGIRQHVCEILEGGKEAFQKREQKYDFPADERRASGTN